MLQLVYLQFTAPRFNEDDFATLMKRYNTILANQLTNPDFLFQQKLVSTLYGGNYRRQQLTPELLETVKLEQMPEVHKRLYSNAVDFSFRIIGNIDADRCLRPRSRPTSSPMTVYVSPRARSTSRSPLRWSSLRCR